ncbi:MAG: sugar phosphate isomerase/epimerase family protein [Acutalibacteraceae bacterium]
MHRIDFGMPTLLELPDAEDCVRLCASLGLRFLELNMNLPQYQPDAVDIERLKRLAERYGVYYTIHLDENFNPFDFNSAVAQAWLETLRRTVRIAAALSAPILNMHLPAGVYFTLPDRRVYLFEAYRETYRDRLRAFRALYESEAGAAGPRLCIENCGDWLPFQLEALAELLESDGFGLTLDVGHNAAAGYRAEPFVLENRHKLCHFHFHDLRGVGPSAAWNRGNRPVGLSAACGGERIARRGGDQDRRGAAPLGRLAARRRRARVAVPLRQAWQKTSRQHRLSQVCRCRIYWAAQ